MNVLNTFFEKFTNLAISLLDGWSPLMRIVVVSTLLGIVMAIVFRFTSNQRKLRRVAELCRADILAIKLFKDDPRVMFRSIGQLLRNTGRRLWYSLPPMFVMLIPFAFLLSHLAVWYEYRPLAEGDTAIVELQLSESAWKRYQEVAPEVPDQLTVETPPLRDLDQKSIFWRIRVNEATPATIHWQIGPDSVDKEVAVASEPQTLSPVSVRLPGPGWWDRLLHPVEQSLGVDSPLRGITIHHQQRDVPLFGWNVPWWATVLIVSMIAALIVKPLVKVQF